MPQPPEAPGSLYVQNRSGAVSARLRRRKAMMNQDDSTKQLTASNGHLNQGYLAATTAALTKPFSASSRLNGLDFEENWTLKMAADRRGHRHRRPRAYSDEWDPDSDEEENEHVEEAKDDFERKLPTRKSLSGLHNNPRLLKCSPMETLDRRISVSTEQLDTLRRGSANRKNYRDSRDLSGGGGGRAKARSSSRPNLDEDEELPMVSFADDVNNNNFEPKSRHFESNKSGRGRASKSRWNLSGRKAKTAKDMFLEDEGPYSRRLYGPPPPDLASAPTSFIDEERRRRRNRWQARSHEHLSKEEHVEDAEEDVMMGALGSLAMDHKKGLLWQQRDKLFSRWKERYFILTRDYLHCFKKAGSSSRMSEMGGFIFKVNLIDILSVDLLDKRGYLTICLSLVKEGKIYLRRPEGIKDWFVALQHNIYDCKRKRKVWEKQRLATDSSGIEQWLLSRQKVGANETSTAATGPSLTHNNSSSKFGLTSVSTPNIKEMASPQTPKPKPQSSHNKFGGLSRSQILDKTESVQQPQHEVSGNPEGPRGIHRMSLVNELILQERLQQQQQKQHQSVEVGGKERASHSVSSENSSTSTSPGMAESNHNNNNVVLVVKGAKIQSKPLEDSGNDSGNNSMHTGSDSNSEGHHSSGDELKNQSGVSGPAPIITSTQHHLATINRAGNLFRSSARTRSLSTGEVIRSKDDLNVLSSDINTLTSAELRANKASHFNRIRDSKSMISSSLRKSTYRGPTYSLSPIIADI